MDTQYKADVQRLLEQMQPHSMLCLGAPCDPTLRDYVAAAPGRLARHFPEPPAVLGHFDLVVVADLLEHLPKSHGEQLLARLRDLHGGRLLLLLPAAAHTQHASRWDDNELLAMGLLRVGSYDDAGGGQHLYRFDLADYKTTPDWLNARFWAHPERWDKDYR